MLQRRANLNRNLDGFINLYFEIFSYVPMKRSSTTNSITAVGGCEYGNYGPEFTTAETQNEA